MIGTTIGQYKILAKIGQGGMAEVFLAQDTNLDRKVALKFLSQELQKNPTARTRFVREGNLGRALKHPNLCQIYETDEVEEKAFIAMEYVPGETLKERIARGRLPLNQVLGTVIEIVEALEKAHGKGFIHRDIKPSNFILTPEGQTKVMDFGLARRILTDSSDTSSDWLTTLTSPGMAVGTLAYMSPEQLRSQQVDVRSDIFSLGVVLYEMLTDVHPFMKNGPLETASAILDESPVPLARYTAEVTPRLQQIVKKMLEKSPDDRYRRIREVKVDLSELTPVR
ncbi:MAG: serine/threonine-protein kinase [Acidobacteriota bacterium]